MKKLLAIILALTLVLSLAACDEDTDRKSSSKKETTSTVDKDTDKDTNTATDDDTAGDDTTGDDTTGEAEHTHAYVESVTAATCTENGVKAFTCSCGDSYTEEIPASGHAWGEWTTHKEATTEAAGEERRYCSNCTSYESKEIPQLESGNQDADNQEENYFYNENNNYYDPNALSIRPLHVYWEDGILVAKCFVINGFSTNAFNIDVMELSFYNDSGLIASGSFGALQDLVLPPYTHTVWTFTFSGDAVVNYGADLGHLICDASVQNYH